MQGNKTKLVLKKAKTKTKTKQKKKRREINKINPTASKIIIIAGKFFS